MCVAHRRLFLWAVCCVVSKELHCGRSLHQFFLWVAPLIDGCASLQRCDVRFSHFPFKFSWCVTCLSHHEWGRRFPYAALFGDNLECFVIWYNWIIILDMHYLISLSYSSHLQILILSILFVNLYLQRVFCSDLIYINSHPHT